MQQNIALPGNATASQERRVQDYVSDAIIDATSAKGLLQVLTCYATGNEALMSNDPWNAGFWATLQAAEDRLNIVLDSAQFALAAASKR